jgi:hypothetical protein
MGLDIVADQEHALVGPVDEVMGDELSHQWPEPLQAVIAGAGSDRWDAGSWCRMIVRESRAHLSMVAHRG